MNKFCIKQKNSSLFFGGFNPDCSVAWVEKEKAKCMCKISAVGQAAAFSANGIRVQKKPVAA